jgi:hypothetical protein
MPYTPTVTFTAASAISATDLNTQNQNLRKYINGQIDREDIKSGSIGTTDIVRGEYFGVTRDHQFTSGEMFTQQHSNERIERSYFTGQTKNIYAFSASIQWVDVVDSGKSFYMEGQGTILYHAFVDIVTEGDNMNYTDVGDGTTIGIQVNGDVKTKEFQSVAFREADPITGVTFDADGFQRRMPYPLSYMLVTSAGGWVNIGLVTNCDSSHGYVQARSVTIEVFYKDIE